MARNNKNNATAIMVDDIIVIAIGNKSISRTTDINAATGIMKNIKNTDTTINKPAPALKSSDF